MLLHTRKYLLRGYVLAKNNPLLPGPGGDFFHHWSICDNFVSHICWFDEVCDGRKPNTAKGNRTDRCAGQNSYVDGNKNLLTCGAVSSSFNDCEVVSLINDKTNTIIPKVTLLNIVEGFICSGVLPLVPKLAGQYVLSNNHKGLNSCVLKYNLIVPHPFLVSQQDGWLCCI